MSHVSNDAPPVLRSSRWRTFVRTWLLEPTLRRVPKTGRVLDLCCGYGFYFSINPNAVGIDGDPQCVAALQSQGRTAQLGNVLETLPYNDASFDFVLAHDVLEHFIMPELDSLFDEIWRVLAPDGVLIAWVPNRRGYDSGVNPEVGHRLFVTQKEIADLAGRRFVVESNIAEPLPRRLGEHFVHNKEVFRLSKRADRAS